MRSSFWILLGSVVAAGVLLVLLTRTGVRQSRPWETATTSASSSESKQPSAKPLLLFCAASNRGPMDAICADYLREFGRSVEIQYGASQTLLSSIEVSHTGDLYLPADASFIDMARDKDLLAEAIPLARMHAVVAVSRENPKQISKFEDLLRPDVRLVQANPDAAAIGKLTRELLGKAGLWDKLNEATTAFRTTVTEAANDVVVGAADAAIVYDAVLHTYPTLTAVTLPELKQAESDVVLAVVKASRQPTAALHFARYASARDRGLKHYAEHGFAPVKGDVWSDQPELSIFAGSMLRPAIEKTITDFEAREGVHVSRVYNGCGILVAQMKAGQHPDAYFACDKEFMNSVPDLFPESVDVSQNQLVILVQKGNPHNIRTLRDLGREGLRVGIGHEKQCAMGWLTQTTLREGGVQKEVMANVMVQTPTGDMLVNQLRAGGLDAAVAYLSNAVGAAKELDAIEIQGLPCSIATQPYGVAVDSPNAQLAQRLLKKIQSAESKRTFMAEGFRWSADLSAAGEHEQ